MLYLSQRITWIACNFLWRLFFRLRVRGIENFDQIEEGSLIFASNHASKFDAFLLGSSIPAKFFKKTKGLKLMARDRHVNTSWYGPVIKWMGAYSIPEKNGQTLEQKLQETVDFLYNGYSVVMFPTGKVSKTCDYQEARPGVAYLAKTCDTRIMPVHIKNSFDLGGFRFLKQRKIEIIFGPVFSAQEIMKEEDDFIKLSCRVMKRVCELA